jgi:transposase-like protein
MEAGWLASQLEAGRSIESIARETGRNASTVAYWVNKHGLTSQHADRHRARGGLTREQLEPLVEEGRSIREIAAELGVSSGMVRHWLRKHALRTRPRRYSLRGEAKPPTLVRECPLHGWTTYVRVGGTRYRCGRCNVESVAARRRRIKEILVREAGGRCLICGFAKYVGALHFHHVDPASKAFSVSRDGVTRSLRRAREEAGKCVLLCANCHAMVEAGLLDLAATADHPGQHN